MKKKLISLALVAILAMSMFGMAASAQTVNPTASTVYVNGASKAFEAYNINNNNYFKLRDLAQSLSGTEKQFEVDYDNDTKIIWLTSGEPYTSVGGEMVKGDGKSKSASPTASEIYFDGELLNLTVYNIGGNNFFKLRDLMQVLDVFVGYDNSTKAITLDTSRSYVPEANASNVEAPEVKVSVSDSELAKIKDEIETFIMDEPTNGNVISYKELNALLAQYTKNPGKGNTTYTKVMYGDFAKKDGKWKSSNSVAINEYWDKSNLSRSERLTIVSTYQPDMQGTVECNIYKDDANFYYYYNWYRTGKIGAWKKMTKTPSIEVTPSPYPDDDYNGSQAREPKVVRYPDAKVAGQDCIVYSLSFDEAEASGMQYNYYMWFSKDKGFEVLTEMFMPTIPGMESGQLGDYDDFGNDDYISAIMSQYMNPSVSATYYYENTNIDQSDAFFDHTMQGINTWVEKAS